MALFHTNVAMADGGGGSSSPKSETTTTTSSTNTTSSSNAYNTNTNMTDSGSLSTRTGGKPPVSNTSTSTSSSSSTTTGNRTATTSNASTNSSTSTTNRTNTTSTNTTSSSKISYDSSSTLSTSGTVVNTKATEEKKTQAKAIIKDSDFNETKIAEVEGCIKDLTKSINDIDGELKKLSELKKQHANIESLLDDANQDYKNGGYLDGGESFHSQDFKNMDSIIQSDNKLIDTAINKLNIMKDRLITSKKGLEKQMMYLKE